jgi:hypothetical protein
MSNNIPIASTIVEPIINTIVEPINANHILNHVIANPINIIYEHTFNNININNIDIDNIRASIINECETNIYKKIDLHGMPVSIEEITILLNNNPDYNFNYTDRNGRTLLDMVIVLASNKSSMMTLFNKIINMPNIPIEMLFHSLNYLNQFIIKLPKNVTRPKLKILLQNKIIERGYNI